MSSSPPPVPKIDSSAPVSGTREIEVDAPVETVWGVLTHVSDWPSWNPNVKSVEVNGLVGEGTTFRWRAGPSVITSTIRHLDRSRSIAWTGGAIGIDAVHVWRLEPRGEGTLVRTEESYDGVVSERRVPPGSRPVLRSRSRVITRTSSRAPRSLPSLGSSRARQQDPAGGASPPSPAGPPLTPQLGGPPE